MNCILLWSSPGAFELIRRRFGTGQVDILSPPLLSPCSLFLPTMMCMLQPRFLILTSFIERSSESSNATIDDYATMYELVYALISSFTRHNISIFVGFGSHLGARRHHGIIPFGEKDVVIQIFSNPCACSKVRRDIVLVCTGVG